jgi:hypothetical protein
MTSKCYAVRFKCVDRVCALHEVLMQPLAPAYVLGEDWRPQA